MLSVVILTYNSQKQLRQTLKSVSWADEVLCIDSGSSDDTMQIISEFNNTRVISQKWLGFGAQKRFGVNAAKHDWIFVLDSDEVMTGELKFELENELKEPKFKAYKVARVNYFFGKAIKTMGLYPDYSVRFFDKKFANFTDLAVHESVKCTDENSKIGRLKNHFLHFAYDSVEQFIAKQNSYSSLNSRQNRLKALLNPSWTFFKLFVLKGGFLEGWRGYIIAKLYSQYTFWKYIK